VRRLNIRRPGQIRNRPGQLENPVIGPGAEVHLLHSRLDQVGAGLIQRTKLANFDRAYIGVGLERNILEPLSLRSPGGAGPRPDGSAGFAGRRDLLLNFSNTRSLRSPGTGGTRGTSTREAYRPAGESINGPEFFFCPTFGHRV